MHDGRLARIFAAAWLEWAQIRRDLPSLSLIISVPIFQLILFGYAVQPLPREVPLAIARSSGGAALVQALEQDKTFRVIADHLKPGEAARMVRDAKAVLAIEFAPLTYDADDVGTPTISVTIDDSDAALALPALAELERRALRAKLTVGNDASMVTIHRLFNAEGRITWSILPALSGVIVMISSLMLGALSIVRERERGTLDFLMASPLRPSEALIGKMIPYLALTSLQTILVLAIGLIVFDLPLRGSFAMLMAASFAAAAAHLSLGFIISALASVQAQAIQGAVMIYLPSMLLSGFLYPFANMPIPAQILGNLFPLTHYIAAARSAILRGGDALAVASLAWPIGLQAILFALAAWVIVRRRL